MSQLPENARNPAKKRKKLFLLITKTEIGGATRHVRDLAAHLFNDYDITVISEPEHNNSWLYHQSKRFKVNFVCSPHLRHSISPLNDARFIFWLYKLCLQEKPDILHIHSSKAGILGRVAGTLASVGKVIFTVHGISFQSKYGFFQRNIFLFAERIAYWLCTDIICVSQHDKSAFVKRVPDTLKKVSVITNEIPEFKNLPARTPRTQLTFGFLGRLAFPKNPLFLLNGFELFLKRFQISCRLLIKGEGPLLDQVKAKTQVPLLTKTVHLIPQDENIESFLSEVDVLVLTSEFEGLPYVLREGRAAGCFLVSSNVGGCREVIVDKSIGELYEEGNLESFVNALHAASTRDLTMRNSRQSSVEFSNYLDQVKMIYNS